VEGAGDRPKGRLAQRPLTRESSAPLGDKPFAKPKGRKPTRTDSRRTELAQASAASFDVGYRWSKGSARESKDWQKSTSGAWPRAPACDEHAEAAWSSPFLSGAKGRKRVRSRAEGGKAHGRWRVRVRGPTRKRGTERTLVDGRRSGRSELVLFDEASRKGGLGGRQALRRTPAATRASGGQHTLLTRGRQRRV
jgi:hypothetical protein